MASGLDWLYLDSTGQEFGPFPEETMCEWFNQGFFPIGEELLVRLSTWKNHMPLRMVYPKLSEAFRGPPRVPAGQQRPQQQMQLDSYGDYSSKGQLPYTAEGCQGRQGGRLSDSAGMPLGAGPPMQQPLGQYWAMPPAGPSYGGNMGYGGYGGYASPSQGRGGYSMGPGPCRPEDSYKGSHGGRGSYGMPMQHMGGQGASGGRMAGSIKSFNLKQGFGFIQCPEAHHMYGRDVFLHKAQIGDLKVGTEVTFIVEMNKQGMPQARDLQTLDGMAPGPCPRWQSGDGGGGKGGSKGGGRGKRKGSGKDSAGERQGAAAQKDTGSGPR